ncbi:MAG: GNAT family N-acetyltransferase [Brevundimonas sp.]|nr:GNAT family N-acetyltransferase [Brevundimonas sp.]MCZ8321451.1 GNAT family N-acetyltransferase [Novosphingobium sp.]
MRQYARVRPAKPTDLSLLPAIERSAAALFADQAGLAHLAQGEVIAEAEHSAFLSRNCLWVAHDGGEVAGFLAATVVAGNFHIRELSVDQRVQGRGLGRALIEAALDAARQRGFAAATLTTFRDVPWNAPFYARCGFRMLPPAELTPALAAILADEQAHGLPEGSRCAMLATLD